MPTFWKDTAGPGLFETPQGKLLVSPKLLKSLLAEGKRMLAKQLPIPIPVKHLLDATPLATTDALSDWNRGFVKDYRIKNGKLQSLLDVPDAAQAARLKTEVKFVSPQIRKSFTDGDGEVFGPCITHVALTPQPVWHRQEPFGDPEPQATLLTAQLGFDYVQLSLDAYSLANEDDDDVPPKKAKKKPPVSEEEDEEEEVDPANEDARLSRIKELLQKMGVKLPEHTTTENFAEHMEVALTTLAHMMGDEDEGTTDSTKLKEEHPPGSGYMMSQLTPELEARIKASEDAAKAAGDAAKVAEGRNKALTASIAHARRESVLKRIDMALENKVIKPARATAWKEVISTFDFAIDAEGKPTVSTIEQTLDVLEADYGKGAAMSLEDRATLLGLHEMGLPEGFDDESAVPEHVAGKGKRMNIDRTKAKELADKQFARSA